MDTTAEGSAAPQYQQEGEKTYALLGGFKVYTESAPVRVPTATAPDATPGAHAAETEQLDACLCQGFVKRFSRRSFSLKSLAETREERWTVRLSGHKKGNNPRIKLEDGRLWALSVPERCSILQLADGPAIFACPVGTGGECHQLQLYTKQPRDDAMIFSLTDGADKCYLRAAIRHTHFQFVFALVTSGGHHCWFITEEQITVTREARKPKQPLTVLSSSTSTSTSPFASASRDRDAPDGCATAAVFRDERQAASALFQSYLGAHHATPAPAPAPAQCTKPEPPLAPLLDCHAPWDQPQAQQQPPQAPQSLVGYGAGSSEDASQPFSFVDPEFDTPAFYAVEQKLLLQQGGLPGLPGLDDASLFGMDFDGLKRSASNDSFSQLAAGVDDTGFSFIDPMCFGLPDQGGLAADFDLPMGQ